MGIEWRAQRMREATKISFIDKKHLRSSTFSGSRAKDRNIFHVCCHSTVKNIFLELYGIVKGVLLLFNSNIEFT